MFVISKKKKKLRTVDAVCEVIAECIRHRSLKPVAWLFRKGHYGSNGCLEGSFLDYMKYCERTGRPIEVAVRR